MYCPQDPKTPQLYVVKREFAEEYETGSYSNIGPKLYLKGSASAVANKNNKREQVYWEPGYDPADMYTNPKGYYVASGRYTEAQLNEWIELARRNHEAILKAGKWVAVPASVSVIC